MELATGYTTADIVLEIGSTSETVEKVSVYFQFHTCGEPKAQTLLNSICCGFVVQQLEVAKSAKSRKSARQVVRKKNQKHLDT